jgi:hypothetical protein
MKLCEPISKSVGLKLALAVFQAKALQIFMGELV